MNRITINFMKTIIKTMLIAGVILAGVAIGAQAMAGESGGVSGIIAAVGNGDISLKLGNGQTIPLKFNSGTVIKVMGKPVEGASALQPGMKAFVAGDHLSLGQPATEIRAYPPSTESGQSSGGNSAHTGGMSGIIASIGNGEISLKLNNGQTFTFKFNGSTVFNVSGKSGAGASALQPGMRAYVMGNHLSLGQPATEIRAYQPTK